MIWRLFAPTIFIFCSLNYPKSIAARRFSLCTFHFVCLSGLCVKVVLIDFSQRYLLEVLQLRRMQRFADGGGGVERVGAVAGGCFQLNTLRPLRQAQRHVGAESQHAADGGLHTRGTQFPFVPILADNEAATGTQSLHRTLAPLIGQGRQPSQGWVPILISHHPIHRLQKRSHPYPDS